MTPFNAAMPSAGMAVASRTAWFRMRASVRAVAVRMGSSRSGAIPATLLTTRFAPCRPLGGLVGCTEDAIRRVHIPTLQNRKAVKKGDELIVDKVADFEDASASTAAAPGVVVEGNASASTAADPTVAPDVGAKRPKAGVKIGQQKRQRK